MRVPSTPPPRRFARRGLFLQALGPASFQRAPGRTQGPKDAREGGGATLKPRGTQGAAMRALVNTGSRVWGAGTPPPAFLMSLDRFNSLARRSSPGTGRSVSLGGVRALTA